MNVHTIRQAWMATLAKAELQQLEVLIQELDVPEYKFLRSPEIGLAMVRGRAGGTGEAFNLGEITITRCVIQMNPDQDRLCDQAISGFGYVAGRSLRHAELAAICDALLQHPSWYEQIDREIIQPLRSTAQHQQEIKQQQTAATKVNFFTLLRGE